MAENARTPGTTGDHPCASSQLGSALQRNLIEDTSMDALTGANTNSGSLTLGEKNYRFPLYEGTIGPEVLDISKLYHEAGIFTYDPGFTSTASCESKITYIDGDAGILLHRGYPIDQLAETSSFLEG